MELIVGLVLCSVACVAFAGGWYLAYRRYWFFGQVAMKDRIRREINENIEAKNVAVTFRTGNPLTAEQLLQFMCYGQDPDPNDHSRGAATYKPT